MADLDFSVRLFASLRETVGHDCLAVAVPHGTTVAQLGPYLVGAAPVLAPYLAATRIAVNRAFAPADQRLAAGDDLALIPPVSGG